MNPGFTIKRRTSLLLFLICTLLLSACGGGEQIPPLNGIILDAYTQKPVAGVTVVVGDTTVSSDAEGKWSVATWKNTDAVNIQATDYATSTLALTDKTAATPTTPITLELTLRPNTISGTLLDEYTQQPIAGALIQTSTGITGTTGTDGAYKLAGVPETYSISVQATDYTSATTQIARGTTFDAALRPTVLSGVLTDKYSQKPITGATVAIGANVATTTAEGRYTLRNVAPDQEILIKASDYTTQTLTVPAGTTLDAVLRPSTVRGTVVDAETGAALSKGTVIALPAPASIADSTLPFTGTAVAMARLSADGTYVLNDVPEGAQIQVLSPGYRKNWTTLSEGNFTADLKVEPFTAKAIYITAATASSKAALSEIFDLVDQTELNAVVIDIKLDIAGDVGGVGYLSTNPLVLEAGTSEDYLDMAWIVAEAHRRNIYLIGRMAVMRDNRLADAKPEWAAQSRETGGVWEDGGGLKWLDPFNPKVTEYNVGIAKEIADYGFDEVQFDYIRFPSDGTTSNLIFSQPIDPENNPEVMYEAIGNVLKEAHSTINGSGTFFSIDVFGYATWRNMWEIGQSLEIMADHTDYVCAMVYPSHYDRNELGLDNADAYPYEIVKDSIEKGQKRIEDKYAVQRPWLQGFTATWLDPVTRYGRAELQAQMRAVDEISGTHGWTIWNAANSYDPNWFN
jgi:hypothetical protein